MRPQRCPWPNPGTCEYVTLHGKKDFADGVKVKDLEKRRLSPYPGGPIQLHEFLKAENLPGDVTTEESERCNVAGFGDGGGGHELRCVSGLSELEKAKQHILYQRKEYSPVNSLHLAQ